MGEWTEENIVVGLLPNLTFVRWFRARCPAEEVKRLQRVETHCLTHFPPTLGEIGRAFSLADVFKCSVKSSGGRVRHGFVILTRLRSRPTGATRETRRP